MIEKMENPNTGKMAYELSHWSYTTELPYVALRTHRGFYDSYEEAENEHNKQVIIDRFAGSE